MSNKLAVPAAARGAMAVGLAAYLEAGSGDPALLVYTTPQPQPPGTVVAAQPAVTILLARPSGSLVDNRWRLVAKNPGGSQAVASGAVVWARLVSGAGLWVADGSAGGPADDVAFKLSGGVVYAGGYVLLGTCEIG